MPVVRCGDGGESAAGEDVGAEVAANFGPLVDLLGQHGSDYADDGAALGEDGDVVGAPTDLFVRPPGGVVGPGPSS